MNKKICIFDFDGTIVDSMNEFADIASKVLNKHFGTPLEKARREYFETSGLPFFEQVELLHPKDIKNSLAAEEYENTKKLTYLEHKKFDDVEAGLKMLKEKGIKTVVSSNNFQELVDALVNKLGLKFDMVLGWRPNFAKGADHFEHARTTFYAQKAEMVFIGDSIKDAQRASSYGIDFIARTGTFDEKELLENCPGTYVIGSLLDLKNVLK